MDSFDIISYSSVTKCRVQYHSYLNNTISTIHFFFLLKMYFLAAIMSKNTNKKNRGHRSRFMAKRQHTWEFRLKMIILWKGTGTIFKIGTFSAERSYSDNRYWPVGVRKRPLLPLFRRLDKTIATFYVPMLCAVKLLKFFLDLWPNHEARRSSKKRSKQTKHNKARTKETRISNLQYRPRK